MLRPVVVILLLLSAFASLAGAAEGMIADALDWYRSWWSTDASPPGMQTCRGEVSDTGYTLRCDPMGVVVAGGFDDAGRCSIRLVTAKRYPEDGLRRTPPMKNPPPGLPPTPSPATRLPCGELPITKGVFEIAVKPRSREVDPALTLRARDQALRFWRIGKPLYETGCVLHLPYVKSGDPFFLAYEECGGRVVAILEFPIHNGEPQDYSHWTYTHRSYGEFAEQRLKRTDLWFGTFTPSP